MGILTKLFRKKPKAQLKSMAGDFKLPAFPKVAMDVRALLRNERSTNQEIGECIKQDPGLTMNLLKSVNSAATSRNRRIADPVQAVGLLGRANLEYMVLAHATRSALPDPKATGYSQEEFWNIAIQRASLAERIARQINPSEAGISYAASLLQDMAIPMLARVMRKQYQPVLESANGDWDTLDEYERDAFGWDHGEFGGWMCEAWSFPDPITSAVIAHHRDVHEDLVVPDAVRAVAFLQAPRPSGADVERLIHSLDESFGVSPSDTRELLEQQYGEAA
ncbi:MAG: HDOD domain-containing protein [Nannocystaceae bacterium]|nr:HDOD domain-containing protein [bacterium]